MIPKGPQKGHTNELRYLCHHCPEKFKHFEQRKRHENREYGKK